MSENNNSEVNVEEIMVEKRKCHYKITMLYKQLKIQEDKFLRVHTKVFYLTHLALQLYSALRLPMVECESLHHPEEYQHDGKECKSEDEVMSALAAGKKYFDEITEVKDEKTEKKS